ncbi:MAG: D-2-hydroxyacid dehydrogenase [Planctomycetaceae bacterium]|nr:D-2-hydroxyacid dehydrogenase [Planctomycetaceae bacterium]
MPNKKKIKLVVLDGLALNPGDLKWDRLEAIGELEVYPATPEEEIPIRAAGALAVFTNKTVLRRETLAQMPDLKYIGVQATGFNVVDIVAARDLGITVTNVPGYSTESVAQLTMAHILNLSFHLSTHIQSVRHGEWSACSDFCYRLTPMVELAGKTLGIIGFGEIGRATARMAQAFGMQVIAYTPSRCKTTENSDPPCDREVFDPMRQEVAFVDLDTLTSESDIVSLHCPLTETNRGLLSRERIARMKPTAFVINTARGPLIDEAALADALNEGRIAGAGLDVLSQEPPPESNPLLTVRNCYISPHSAWGTMEARLRLMVQVAANLQAFLDGKPINVIASATGK